MSSLSMVICSPAPNLTAQALNDHLHKLFYTHYEVQIPSTKLRSTKHKVQSSKHKVHSCGGTNLSTFNSRPSVVTVIVPHLPVVSTSAPLTCQRSTTSLWGWPNTEVWPTEIIAT